jgi:hypothetical protein
LIFSINLLSVAEDENPTQTQMFGFALSLTPQPPTQLCNDSYEGKKGGEQRKGREQERGGDSEGEKSRSEGKKEKIVCSN